MKRTSSLLHLAMASAMLLIGACLSTSRCEAAPAREFIVKAAFLYNFAQFVEWPSEAFGGDDAPFVIGVVGDDPFDGALEQAVRDKKVGGHPIVVQHYRDASALRACHILYVSASEGDEAGQIIQKVGDTTLTVGDFDGFTAKGGIFRFLLEENRVRFEVNVAAAKKVRLKISSKLLKLAKVYGQ